MNEIELKAHVKDRQKLILLLNKIATYKGAVTREDTYYKQKNPVSTSHAPQIRIRKESFPENAEKSPEYLLTYKRKEKLCGPDKIQIEVNDEKECKISSPQAIEAFLQDAGFEVSLKKRKEVKDWILDGATLELCNVPPLGDFLEIEILSEDSSEENIKNCRKKLESILKKAEIPKEQIENRYYSQMLREVTVNPTL